MEDEDEEKKTSMKHFVLSELDKFFIGHIPIDSFKELAPTYMYYFGTVAYIASIALFIYFTKTSYDQNIDTPYISITPGGGQSCNTVPISISDSYMADNKGNWVGTPQFIYSEAEFYMTFQNFKVSQYQYEAMLNAYQQGLEQIGATSATQNLAQNLVYWMSYIRYYSIQDPSLTNFTAIGHGQLQYIQLSGNPASVFDPSYVQGHIISKAGYCTESSVAFYDQANGNFITNMNYSTFITKSECLSAINPLSFGYYPAIDLNVFELVLDVYAFATAMAVNTGILPISSLGVASSEYFQFTYENATYRTGQYFDIRYPMMNTIICIQNTTIIPPGSTGVSDLCMYQVGNTLTLPVFNHFGTNYEFPDYCECGTNGASEACNEFNLLAGLLFFPGNPDTPGSSEKTILQNSGIFDLIILVNRNGGYANLNRNAYNASFAAAAPAFGKQSGDLDTNSWRKRAFSFCTLNAALSCSMMVFNAFDPLSKKVSPFKYQLNNGSCHNAISIDSEYWNKLVYSPPVDLTQDYYECYEGPFGSLFAALGIASGNTSLAVPIIVMAILPLLYLVLVFIKQVPPKEEYSDPEKKAAIEILSVLLLRLRDGKTRGVKKAGVLMKLAKELVSAAKEEGGYPDSDDEDEDDAPPTSPKPRRKSGKSFRQSLDNVVDSDDEEEAVGAAPIAPVAPSPPRSGRQRSDDKPRKLNFDESATARQSTAAMRRSSAKMKRAAVTSSAQRPKMAVFTKQLEEPKQPFFRRKSATTNRDSTAPAAGGGGGVMNMFGGGNRPAPNANMAKEQELAVYLSDSTNPLSLGYYVYANSPNLPKDLQILNSEALGVQAVSKFSKVLTGDDIDLLADDLIKLFGEALKDVNRHATQTADESDSYLQGKQLSSKLCKVVLSDLLEREDKSIFFKLSNALCMHASIELRLEMRVVGSQYPDSVAYNIGGKVLTISNLDKIM